MLPRTMPDAVWPKVPLPSPSWLDRFALLATLCCACLGSAARDVQQAEMDIEEAEPAALAGCDIERFRPELVCIEVGQRTRERLLAYFSAHGYERIDAYLAFDDHNWYFRPTPSGID